MDDDDEFPELTDEQLAEFRPFADVLPELAAKMRRSIALREDEKVMRLMLGAGKEGGDD